MKKNIVIVHYNTPHLTECLVRSINLFVKDAVIYSSTRTVTAVDVENIVIVETPDAIMVCSKDKAQEVKKIVDKLKVSGRQELL